MARRRNGPQGRGLQSRFAKKERGGDSSPDRRRAVGLRRGAGDPGVRRVRDRAGIAGRDRVHRLGNFPAQSFFDHRVLIDLLADTLKPPLAEGSAHGGQIAAMAVGRRRV